MNCRVAERPLGLCPWAGSTATTLTTDERFHMLPKGFQETEANVHKLNNHHPGRVLHKNGLGPFCAAVSRSGKQFIMMRQSVLDGYCTVLCPLKPDITQLDNAHGQCMMGVGQRDHIDPTEIGFSGLQNGGRVPLGYWVQNLSLSVASIMFHEHGTWSNANTSTLKERSSMWKQEGVVMSQ